MSDDRTGRKPTKVERDQRIRKVVELLTFGLRPHSIWQYVSEKTDWEISIRTVHRYIKAATAIIRTESHTDRELETGKALERLDILFQRNMTIQDFKAALAVTKTRIDMLGLAAPKEIKAQIVEKQTWAEFIATQDNLPGESESADEDEIIEDDEDDLDDSDSE